jgi:hypothetical protein
MVRAVELAGVVLLVNPLRCRCLRTFWCVRLLSLEGVEHQASQDRCFDRTYLLEVRWVVSGLSELRLVIC